jgi:hypothetical protein
LVILPLRVQGLDFLDCVELGGGQLLPLRLRGLKRFGSLVRSELEPTVGLGEGTLAVLKFVFQTVDDFEGLTKLGLDAVQLGLGDVVPTAGGLRDGEVLFKVMECLIPSPFAYDE